MNAEIPELTGLRCALDDRVLTVLFDHGPLNLLDGPLMSSLSRLARWLSGSDDVTVVLFGSANPDFFIAHLDVEILQSATARTAESVAASSAWSAGFAHCGRPPSPWWRAGSRVGAVSSC
ncbi:Probable enoyl-CoA hydratase [Mycobacteroides abscessus]|nr:Probable enoyl-CoA hydratase [Mycobacteroides abscessus]